MASLAAASRLSLRLAGRPWIRASRGFHSAARLAVAQNFTMPALSPTMTEGNIAAWRVKEGDKFVAGDVLLEIETDKATMDVEAQEDGVVFKILQADGSKGVPVGARIGVLAEADDDVSTLEMPPDEAPAPAEATAAASASSSGSSSSSSSGPSEPAKKAAAPKATTTTTTTTAAQPQKYPLFPSVEQLIKENGLDPKAVVGQMTPTGPGGRLLKGDVLAFLGKVSADVPVALEKRYETLAHLDLSNIKIRAPAPAPAQEKADAAAAAAAAKAAKAAEAAAEEKTTVVSLPVSLSAVVDVQGKLQSSLGVFLPVSTFVARATDVANDALPRVGPAPAPSAAELFDAIVSSAPVAGAPNARATTRGHYHPQISALPAKAQKSKTAAAAAPTDVLDILTGKVPATTRAVPGRAGRAPPAAVSTGTIFFSVAVPQAEAKRAQVFLERLKTVLETEPGRLVL